jgi:endo-1,4-beta-xylanase
LDLFNRDIYTRALGFSAPCNGARALLTLVSFATSGALACGSHDGAPGTPDDGGDAGDASDAGADGGADDACADAILDAGADAMVDAAFDVAFDAGAAERAVETSPPTTLRGAAAQSGRRIGAALAASHLSEAAFASTAAAQLNYATPENEMKWDATEPTRNAFQFGGGDAIVAFAAANGIAVKGHTLVWHSQLPAWVSAITSASDLHAAMLNHITQVVSHYRGKVAAWDVVNEAWNDNGKSLRGTIFYTELGASYIDDAFAAAHAADPNARLYYNDYGGEGSGNKSDAIYTMVQGMITRGVPINGVGLQMHTGPADASPSAADVAVNMRRLGALGLDVVISEMDVQICSSDLDTQRERFHDIAADCMAEPACKALTVWGVPDKYSWRNGTLCPTPRPLLFDDSYVPKPAHAGVLDAFLGR